MGLEYEHNHYFIASKFLSEIIIWCPIVSKDRPGLSLKWEMTILELWCGMAA